MPKAAKEAHKLRQENQAHYEKFNVEPTEVDGTVFNSRLEALWFEELKDCDSFKCAECVKVPVWIQGPYGQILGNYKPDFLIETDTGDRVLVELKPTKELAMADDRQRRALELNPKMKFLVIGGYPYESRGVFVKMMTGTKEIQHKNVPVCGILELLGCECGT